MNLYILLCIQDLGKLLAIISIFIVTVINKGTVIGKDIYIHRRILVRIALQPGEVINIDINNDYSLHLVIINDRIACSDHFYAIVRIRIGKICFLSLYRFFVIIIITVIRICSVTTTSLCLGVILVDI